MKLFPSNSSILLIALTSLSPSVALAHTGVGNTEGVMHGFLHPLSGIDHILAMVAVGMFAAHLGGRAIWLVPLSFLTMMTIGGAVGMAGIPIPFVEIGIGLSVVVLGAAVALGLSLPLAAAMTLVGVFAVFHGHAHGAEMPETASGLGYAADFIVATALLHAVGIAAGVLIAQLHGRIGTRVRRLAGGAAAVAGLGILAGWF